MSRHFEVAQLRGRLYEGIEHRLEIEGGTADDLEHVGGASLLRRRFTQLVEQTSVLDGDDCWAANFYELDLLVAEWSDLLSVDNEGTDNSFSLSMGMARMCGRRRASRAACRRQRTGRDVFDLYGLL